MADGIGILSAIVRYTAGNILKAGGFYHDRPINGHFFVTVF